MSLFSIFIIVHTLCMFVLVILWLQSGLDKVMNYKSNLDWLKGHFSKSILKNMVPLLLALLTIFEISSGLLSLAGIIGLVFFNNYTFAYIGLVMSLLSLVSLFKAQRLAKDYAGAANLMGYFIFTLLIFFFTAWLHQSFHQPEPLPYIHVQY